MNSHKKLFLIFSICGTLYGLLEVLWRGYTHWSMVLTGGLCSVSLYRINQTWHEKKLFFKCTLGAAAITGYELVAGCFVNLLMGWRVWDYSNQPFNLMGQICPLFSVLWFFLCIPVFLFFTFTEGRISFGFHQNPQRLLKDRI